MEQPVILGTLLQIVRDLASHVSEQCLEHCLRAIAALVGQGNQKAIDTIADPQYAVAMQRIATDFLSYPNEEFQTASVQIVAQCHQSAALAATGLFSGQVLRWTLTSLVSLIYQKFSTRDKPTSLPVPQLTSLIESATFLMKGNKQMQKIGNSLRLQSKLTDLIKVSRQIQAEEQKDEEMETEKEQDEAKEVDRFKQCIVACFAVLTEKIEDARSEFVQNSAACVGLVELIGQEAEMTSLQLAAFTLLVSLGRAKLIKKKILRERFIDKKINFVDRVSK